MSIEADYLVDRRKLRRKLTLWRVLAFVGAAIAVVVLGFFAGGKDLIERQSEHIARLTIEGVITGDKRTLDVIKRVKESGNAKAVVISINSPGGTTTGSEALHLALRDLARAKPTVAVVTGVAASGAYIAAMGSDHIVAPQTAIVGSIGVIIQYPNVSRLLDTVGVKFESVRSSPLKAQPSGYEPTLPEARAALEATVADSYTWFKDMVKDRRALNDAELAKVADGRVFTGRQGLPLKLIDAIGNEVDGVSWLENEKKIAKNLPVRDYRRVTPDRLGLLSASAVIAEFIGFGAIAESLRASQASLDVHSLDGLVSVWHPNGQN